MDWFFVLLGCIGAWLLVAGPLLQASNELRRIGLDAHRHDGDIPSVWWWFSLPLIYILGQRDLHNDEPQTRDLKRTATGWYFVATGGCLIALKETWELGETLELDPWIRILIFIVMFVIVWLSTSIRMIVQTFQDRSDAKKAE